MMSIKFFIQILFALIFLFFVIIKRFFKISLTKELATFDILLVFFLSLTFFVLSLKAFFTVIRKNITPSSHSSKNISNYLLQIIQNAYNQFYYIPLKAVDDKLNNILIKKYNIERITYVNQFLSYIYTNVLKQNQYNIINKYFMTYFGLKYLPKLFVMAFFLLDIFYYRNFYYFYWALPLLIIPLILQYLVYILFFEYKEFYTFLDIRIEVFDIIPSTPENMIPVLSISEYLEKAFNIHIKGKINPYLGNPDNDMCGIGLTYTFFDLMTPEQVKKLKNFDYKKAKKTFMRFLLWVEKVHVIYVLLTKKERILDQYINLIVFTCYFIGWTYILLISLKDVSYLSLLECSKIDPFSDLTM